MSPSAPAIAGADAGFGAKAEVAARALLGVLLALGIGLIWLSPRPPMVDLAQHAAQVSLLRDLLSGQTAWAGLEKVNPFTPYLIGYGLALPLSFLMPIAAAMKAVLSAAFVAFVVLARQIARELGAPPVLDPYYPLGFFGYAYAWGFYTFLVAAPVGLAFVWLSLRYAKSPRMALGAALIVLGVLLFLSHALVFLFCAFAGWVFWLLNAGTLKRLIVGAWPFLGMAIVPAVYVLAARSGGGSGGVNPTGAPIVMGDLRQRMSAIVSYPFHIRTTPWTIALFLTLAAAPFVLGYRIAWGRKESLAFAAIVGLILCLAPRESWTTNYVDTRFSLFSLVSFAWLFTRDPARPASARKGREALGLLAIFGAALSVSAIHQLQAYRFRDEERDFEQVLAAARPNERAFSLILNPYSRAMDHPYGYLHFPAWYQAEKHGFTEFNFAWFAPQVVRYRRFSPEYAPKRFAKLEDYSWRAEHGDRYAYFFVRNNSTQPVAKLPGAPCPLRIVAHSGLWTLLERTPCPT